MRFSSVRPRKKQRLRQHVRQLRKKQERRLKSRLRQEPKKKQRLKQHVRQQRKKQPKRLRHVLQLLSKEDPAIRSLVWTEIQATVSREPVSHREPTVATDLREVSIRTVQDLPAQVDPQTETVSRDRDRDLQVQASAVRDAQTAQQQP